MAHRNAKLTPFGRRLLVDRIVVLGWSVPAAAESMGVSRATAYKWLRRFREGGYQALEDRPSKPRTCPHALPVNKQQRILRARQQRRQGPHQLAAHLGMPRSTIYGVLRRHGLSRLDHADRVTGAPVRFAKQHPGEMLQVDVKKLARIPDGGGWRMLGRGKDRHGGHSGAGYEYIHTALDDCSRVAFSMILPDETGPTCAFFLTQAAAGFAKLGVKIQCVQTDEALNYRLSEAFQSTLAAIGARHKTTGPYSPQRNGKVERYHRTLLEEWAYRRLYRTNSQRRAAFTRWNRYYNHHRPHTAHGGQPPMTVLVNKVHGNYS